MTNGFSEREFRDAMSQFCTGVVVVSGQTEAGPAGFSVQSFVSVSLDPPLIAVCPALGSTSWPKIRDLPNFGINILGVHQEDLCKRFASPNIDRFEGVAWTPSPYGTPMLDDTLGFIDCALEAEHDAGDHALVVARVLEFQLHEPLRNPLLFFRGSFGSFAG
tara:strand:- start:435 stop:920 length:486 start_codon:yes stop_codon:yes gene_type:complete